jgi:hypothetical protein
MMFNVELYGRDWKGNRHDYSWLERVISIPEWYYDIDPSSHKIVAGTTQVLAMNRKYTIPFNSEKIDELKKYFTTPLSCIVIVEDGKKYSCSLNELQNSNFDDLVNLKTGLTDYMKNRQGLKTYS